MWSSEVEDVNSLFLRNDTLLLRKWFPIFRKVLSSFSGAQDHHATWIREDERNTFVRKGDPGPLKKGALYLFEKSATIFSASQCYARGREHPCEKEKEKKNSHA